MTAATATVLVLEFLRCRTRPLPTRGWAGLVALAAAEFLMFRGVQPVATYFTPIAWTAYLFLADAMVWSIRGRSRLSDESREFALLCTLSLPLWMIFEGYNLRLENWAYTGLPANWFARNLGYAWSFMTITPAILLTADLVESFEWFTDAARKIKFTRPTLAGMTAAGALCLTVPLLLPPEAGAYLFALVWVGFILLLEPANYRLGLPSLLRDLEAGRRSRLYALLISGWACGWLWEFWNFWAAARWQYVFPIFQRWKIFAMPAPGYLGFLPFALECSAMMVFARWMLEKLGARRARTPES
ncbi:MAG TPA: hypothetical protein VJW51_00235 [Candidatus Acidoferrales bacterium]|nr:hypothetical protein [Candidatus Acidoferrales bacterium]